ncbi:High mobility group protein B2 [Tupaia chinensis]|uniref:High mobility group protein B2 n=1 Tax=Tupaia chinensis TaxID=246437 RepID=L9LD72_TUPCH|nr:High mobility group protein B2 [Tupaia chinensis]
MGKGDPNKPRDKMSSYAFFVQTCREEHKKKLPDSSVNFTEFSKKCWERWKTMSAKEKLKFEDMAKSDRGLYDREMKSYKTAKLKEKYEEDIAAYCAKGKSEAGKKGPGRPTGSKRNEPEDEEEEEEEEEDEEQEDEDEE